MPDTSRSIDAVAARNNTLVNLLVDNRRVGRVQQFRQSQSNNVQVLAELGRAYMVEMQQGIVAYTFSISSFFVHADVMDELKDGKPFGISIQDASAVGGVEVLERFSRCMIQSMTRNYTVGAAAIGQDAEIAVIGKGIGLPTTG